MVLLAHQDLSESLAQLEDEECLDLTDREDRREALETEAGWGGLDRKETLEILVSLDLLACKV